MSELSSTELKRRMAEVHVDVDSESVRKVVVAYLESGAVGSTNIGRHYAVSDPGQRDDFAEWFASFYEQLFRFNAVTHEDAGDDPDEGPDDEDE